MKPGIEFYFDFGSPNAYLSYKCVPALEQRLGTKVEMKPALLGGIFKATNNQSPFTAYADIPAKMAYERLEMTRFVKRHGLNQFRLNPFFPINTLQLMRGAILAMQTGVFEPYIEMVFSAMWEKGLNMGDEAIFAEQLQSIGIDSAEFIAKLADSNVKQPLVEATEAAVRRGVFGSPSFFVGDELFFGKDRLDDVEREYLRATGA